MGANVGTLLIEIGADVARLRADMGKAYQEAQNGAQRIASAFKGIAFGFIGFESIKMASEHLYELGRGALEAGEKFAKLEQQTGVAAEVLSTYSVAARLNEKSIDDVAKALGKLSKNMYAAASDSGDAKEAFTALGVDVKDASGNLKGSDAVMSEIADKFSGMEDGAGKTALAMMLFGKTGAEMIPILDKGSEGLETMKKKAQEMGLIFSSEAAAQAEELNDRLKILGMRSEGIANQIIGGMVPALEASVSMFEELTKSEHDFTGASTLMSDTVKGAADVFLELCEIGYGTKAVVVSIYWAFSALTNLLGGELTIASEQYAKAQKALVDDLLDDLAKVASARAALYKETPHTSAAHSGAKEKAPILPNKEKATAFANALASITVELAKANETQDDGAGKLAELNEKYKKFAEVLGANNPKVREFAGLVAYANQHLGRTPVEVSKLAEALQTDLDKANITVEEGGAAFLEWSKKLEQAQKVILGKGQATPETTKLLEGLGEAAQFALTHMGKTRVEVAKLNKETKDYITTIADELSARAQVADLFGQQATETLALLQAEIQAQKLYAEVINNGGDEATAASKKAAFLVKAQADLADQRDKAARSLATGYSGSVYEQERKDLMRLYADAEKYTTDREALARSLNENLADLESKRLQATARATDGAKAAYMDYARTAMNEGANMYALISSGFKTAEDGMASFLASGEYTFATLGSAAESMVQSIAKDVFSLAIKENITGPIANMMSLGTGATADTALIGAGASLGTASIALDTSAVALNSAAAALYASAAALSTSAGVSGTGSVASLTSFNPFSMLGSLFHSGGVVGQQAPSSRMVSPFVFSGAPRLHNGLAADEFPAILQSGEEVRSRSQVARDKAAGGGGATHVHTHVWNISTPDVAGFKRSASQIEAEMARRISRASARNN